ncbi:hypothetical protein F4Y59_04525 [Candidatus Poribacteria bacterium]|nr:hypothetical protein [Candidatus Poribacteria bacterium]
MNDGQMRENLSQKARERALSFTWDKTAQRIVQFFEELRQKRQLASPNGLLSVFSAQTETSNSEQQHLRYKSILLGMNKRYERSLMGDPLYSQRVEEGLLITFLKNHTVREAEALLTGFIEDEAEAKAILKRIQGLIHATA